MSVWTYFQDDLPTIHCSEGIVKGTIIRQCCQLCQVVKALANCSPEAGHSVDQNMLQKSALSLPQCSAWLAVAQH